MRRYRPVSTRTAFLCKLFTHCTTVRGRVSRFERKVSKLLDFDWLKAVQFKCNTSAKSATPVQKRKKE